MPTKLVNGRRVEMAADEVAALEASRKPDPAKLADSARAERDRLLAASDWTVLPDAPVADPQAWRHYRQALRDVTAQEAFPFEIDWPEPPAA